ncbi:MAG: hypothetical protein H6Q56_1715 [Deltaproteobacteria bacterium]|nr:hypothetical protein [Deltaproteobacteria bacterium]
MTAKPGQETDTSLQSGQRASRNFADLPLQQKIDALHKMSGALQVTMIHNEAHPELFVQSLPLLDFYRIIRAVGAESSLFQLASPEQVRFVLDLELWEAWSISQEEAIKWLETLLDTGDKHAVRLLAQLDLELLLIFLKKNMSVGGGLGDIINSEDYQGVWDHTFDEIFYLHLHDEDSSELILRMLELLYTEEHALYRSLMLGVENELLTELEEVAWQFRSGRLEDEGLPPAVTATTLFTILKDRCL